LGLQGIEIEARFNSILEKYGAFLRSTIAAHCPRDLGLSFDDIFQEVSVRLWHALCSEREIVDLASYLHRVAATARIDALRRVKARREEQMQLSAAQEGEVNIEGAQRADTNTSPEALAQYQQLISIVEGILQSLSQNRQRAVRLHLQGLSTGEIAELMGWGEAKARNLVYRGLDDLRRQLGSHGFEFEYESE
jgi:RNA polymerase sigma-70 factor (ECF subfamily)